MSGCISVAAGNPASHSAVPHSPPSSASISPNAFFPFGFGVGIYLQKLQVHSFCKFSQIARPPANFSYAVKSLYGAEWCYINFYFLKVFFLRILGHKSMCSCWSGNQQHRKQHKNKPLSPTGGVSSWKGLGLEERKSKIIYLCWPLERRLSGATFEIWRWKCNQKK